MVATFRLKFALFICCSSCLAKREQQQNKNTDSVPFFLFFSICRCLPRYLLNVCLDFNLLDVRSFFFPVCECVLWSHSLRKFCLPQNVLFNGISLFRDYVLLQFGSFVWLFVHLDFVGFHCISLRHFIALMVLIFTVPMPSASSFRIFPLHVLCILNFSLN